MTITVTFVDQEQLHIRSLRKNSVLAAFAKKFGPYDDLQCYSDEELLALEDMYHEHLIEDDEIYF